MQKLTIILFIAALSSACTHFNRPSVGASEIVERSTVPQDQAHVDDVEYQNLCVHKDCDETSIMYSQAFRDAALLTHAIRELDRYAFDASAHGKITGLRHSDAQMPQLERELEHVRDALERLDPGADFESVKLQIVTRKALIKARQDTDAARHALKRADASIDAILTRGERQPSSIAAVSADAFFSALSRNASRMISMAIMATPTEMNASATLNVGHRASPTFHTMKSVTQPKRARSMKLPMAPPAMNDSDTITQ
jgi:hypothetical protein